MRVDTSLFQKYIALEEKNQLAPFLSKNPTSPLGGVKLNTPHP